MRKKKLLAILAIGERSRGELASELGISSQPWLSRAYLSPLMAQGYIAHTSPKKSPSRRCSATGFCARGRMSWHEYNIYSKTYTEGSDPFCQYTKQNEMMK